MKILLRIGRNISATLLRKPTHAKGGLCSYVQSAGLISITDPEYANRPPKPKPFPYETKNFSPWRVYIDSTNIRLDENSKLIVVEGNVGVDKEGFAKKVAEEFGMKYVPAVTMDDLYITKNGFDRRDLNQELGLMDKIKFWDFESLYTTKNPRDAFGFLQSQIDLYKLKFQTYLDAVAHIWNTGQGVVMVRSALSDICFAKALRRRGVFTRKGYKHYEGIYFNTETKLLSPHLIIYLDAPVQYCRDQITARGVPWEQGSSILTDEFLQDVENIYRQDVLPQFLQLSEMITYDVTMPMDYELVMEDLNETNLDGPKVNEDMKFYEWEPTKDIDMNVIRFLYDRGNRGKWKGLFSKMEVSRDVPEFTFNAEERAQYMEVQNHPGIKFPKYYDPVTGRY